MKLRQMRATWPAGVDPHGPALPYVQDLDPEDVSLIDDTLRAATGVGVLEVDLAAFSGVQGVLEFHSARDKGEPRSGLAGRKLSEFADEFSERERYFTELFLLRHGGVGFDEADVRLFFDVRAIVEFDAARQRKNTREPCGGRGV